LFGFHVVLHDQPQQAVAGLYTSLPARAIDLQGGAEASPGGASYTSEEVLDDRDALVKDIEYIVFLKFYGAPDGKTGYVHVVAGGAGVTDACG